MTDGREAAGEAVVMSLFVRVCAVAGALLLGGCAGPSWDWMPSMPSMSSGANVSLTIESDPPGADAKTSLGASCRTPCMIPVAADREFTVSYSLHRLPAAGRAGAPAHARRDRSPKSRPAARCRRST